MILCSKSLTFPFSFLDFFTLVTVSIFSFPESLPVFCYVVYLSIFFNFAWEIGAWLAKLDPFAHALRFNVVLSTRGYSPA